METTNKKSTLKFDAQQTLLCIESDKKLDNTFRDEVSMGYPELHLMIKNDTLPENINQFLKDIFIQIILKRGGELLKAYEDLNGKSEGLVEELIEDDTIPTTVEVKNPKRVRFRLNKKKLAELKAKYDKPPMIFDLAESAFKLRNMFEKIERKIDNHLYDGKKVSDKQIKEIIARTDTYIKVVNKILKEK
jgi:hypothetical protein